MKVKVTHQGEGHIKVKVKYLHPFKFYVAHTLCKRVVCIRLKCYLLAVKFNLARLGDWANFYFLGKLFKKLGQIFFMGNILFFLGKKPRKLIISGHIFTIDQHWFFLSQCTWPLDA